MGTHHRIGTIALFVSLSLLTASAQVKPGEVRHSIQSSSSGITWAIKERCKLLPVAIRSVQ